VESRVRDLCRIESIRSGINQGANTLKQEEPLVEILIGNCQIILLGTAHISHASVLKVEELLSKSEYDAVAVELCLSRHKAITDPDALAKLNMFEVIREGKAPMVIANLALGAFQQKIADDLGLEPGAEMRTALKLAEDQNLPPLLIDREIGITLKRCYQNIPWWQRFYLFAGLLSSVFSFEKVQEDEIEKLKQGDIMEAAFSHFADSNKGLYTPLIHERDVFMATRLYEEILKNDYKRVIAIVGAGHLKGITKQLKSNEKLSDDEINAALAVLNQTPKSSKWPKVIPWLIVILILAGFTLGFNHSTDLGWQLVADWVLINGGLSALGALLAAAHPLTIITAFLAAPLTSLNPMIGAGMVTAGAEILLRKPNVGDFKQLRKDATHLKGWWKNRVARTLLVFLFSTTGSAVGTYVAGFRILERLS